jgi:enamine deaminase RidA (YjgF/YER057c/UK114 family)
VWDSWVTAGHTPARATVEAKLAAPQYKVEIMVVAAR